MKKKIYGSAFALIVMAMTMPVQADVIADQSRIKFSSPLSPSLDQVMLPSGALLLLR